MTLHLRQVEIWAAAVGDQMLCVVKEVETKVEKRGGDRLLIHFEMLFVEVPTSGTHHQGCDLGVEAVLLPFRTGVSDRTGDGVSKVGLSLEVVVPGGRVGVLKIGHE